MYLFKCSFHGFLTYSNAVQNITKYNWSSDNQKLFGQNNLLQGESQLTVHSPYSPCFVFTRKYKEKKSIMDNIRSTTLVNKHQLQCEYWQNNRKPILYLVKNKHREQVIFRLSLNVLKAQMQITYCSKDQVKRNIQWNCTDLQT